MQEQRWSKPLWHSLASSSLWDEGRQAALEGRELKSGWLRLYLLLDPDNCDIRYVGLTSKSLTERLAGHMKESRSKSETHKARWLRTLDTEPLIIEIFHFEEPLALVAEQAIIAVFRGMGIPLTNTHAGGGGFDSHGESARDRVSAGISAAWARGAYGDFQNHSARSKKAWETRRKRLESGELQPQKSWNAGKKLPPEVGANIRAGKLKGRKSQVDMVQDVANHAQLTYNQVYRSLKASKQKPSLEVRKLAWATYEKLGDRVADLVVDHDSKP